MSERPGTRRAPARPGWSGEPPGEAAAAPDGATPPDASPAASAGARPGGEAGAGRGPASGDRIPTRAALPPDADSGADELEPGSWRATRLSTAFVVFALFALLAVPIVVQRRIAGVIEHTIDVAAAARDLMDDVERALAVEVASIRAYALTGDEAYLRTFEAARNDNRRALVALRPLTRRLAVYGVAASADSLENLLHSWEEVPLSALTRPGDARAASQQLARQQRLFERIVNASAALDAALRRATEGGRREVQRAQDLGMVLTVLLALLSLAAVLLLARLASQLRSLAGREAQLRRELQASFRSRERLIRGFSHDLKNPLGAVDGYAQLLEGGLLNDPEKLRASAARIRSAIGAALQLIDDILDMARAEAGELRVARKSVEVRAIVRELATQYGPQAARAGLTLDVEVPDDLPDAESDAARVRQILANLLSNAIKYTSGPGHVGMRAFAVVGAGPRPDLAEWVVVEVWDEGPGIAPADQERVFHEFTRLSPESKAGAGIGLAISLRLARVLGGELTLRSHPGEGSVFSLWLPMAPDR